MPDIYRSYNNRNVMKTTYPRIPPRPPIIPVKILANSVRWWQLEEGIFGGCGKPIRGVPHQLGSGHSIINWVVHEMIKYTSTVSTIRFSRIGILTRRLTIEKTAATSNYLMLNGMIWWKVGRRRKAEGKSVRTDGPSINIHRWTFPRYPLNGPVVTAR